MKLSARLSGIPGGAPPSFRSLATFSSKEQARFVAFVTQPALPPEAVAPLCKHSVATASSCPDRLVVQLRKARRLRFSWCPPCLAKRKKKTSVDRLLIFFFLHKPSLSKSFTLAFGARPSKAKQRAVLSTAVRNCKTK